MISPVPNEADTRAMRRLQEGHESAFNELMDRHASRLFHYLVRCLQDEDDAADLAQETFVKLYTSRHRFNLKQKFSTWLYTIASNLVKDRYRWRSRHPQICLDAHSHETAQRDSETLTSVHPSPADGVWVNERADAVRRALSKLPEELRQPLVFAEYEERSHAEIGAILGCTEKAVETRIYRARQRLRSSLSYLLESG